MTQDQLDFLRNHNEHAPSNIEAIILHILARQDPDSSPLPKEAIFVIANTRYSKAESSVYYYAMMCLDIFGLIKPFIEANQPNDGIMDYYQITAEGRAALTSLLSS